jgi:inhibitor of cysteine peptidase
VEGQQFSIALRSNPTTGYRWQPSFDAGALASISSTYVPDVPMRVGSGGTEVFTFQALRAGTSKIMFDYVRSWERGAINETSYTVTVR